MAEQITHIKSLKRLDIGKRKLLKDYYRLERDSKDNDNSSNNSQEQNDISESPVCVEREAQVPDINLDEPLDVSSKTLKQLVQVQNLLLTEETEADNTIKNTIYDNYYDLIKVDQLLQSMGQMDEGLVEQLRNTCTMARELR